MLKQQIEDCYNNKKMSLQDYTTLISYLKRHNRIIHNDKINEILTKCSIQIPQKIRCVNEDLMNELQESASIEFTKDQLMGITEMIDFLKSSDEHVYGLYGYAGTGKTTTLVELLSYLITNKYICKVAFTAPTNKAVNIIKSKLRNNLKTIYDKTFPNSVFDSNNMSEMLDMLQICGIVIDFMTIHRMLNYKNDVNLEGERIFVKSNGSLIANYDIVVIDECSMVSSDMIIQIFTDLKKNDGKNKKIIFSGDSAQLPSVNEEISPIFITNETKDKMNISDDIIKSIIDMRTVTMCHVKRTNIDSVLNVCYEIREWITSNKPPQLNKYRKLLNGVYFYKATANKLDSQWFVKFINYQKKPIGEKEQNIILTWTNHQTNRYNTEIRKHVLNKENLKTYEIGDLLMLGDFYNLEENTIKSRFYTSEQIQIKTIDECENERLSFEYIDSVNMPPVLQEKFKKCVNELNNKTTRRFRIYKMKTVRIPSTNDTEFTIKTIHETSEELLKQEKLVTDNHIKKFKTLLSVQYGEHNEKINEDIIKPLWKQWNKIFVEQFANVTYGHAHSVHKSQGSSFYNVFVDAHDILNNPNIDEAKRCLYTAFTRAGNELHILI